jgi:TM2 domain-containing membrane protein YozV
MSKILEVRDDIVKIGTDDGKIKEVRREDVNFSPVIGDKVEMFENESSVIVTKIEEKKPEENTQQGGVNININNSNTNTNPNTVYSGEGKKVVNKWVYVLLAFFLGGIGAHKFYAGKIGAGICYLLFCWTGIPALIAFIEWIIALCAKADSNGNILV